MPTPFEILGVSRDADAEQIRGAYHKLVKRWHPDTIADAAERERAQNKLVEINLAYEKALKESYNKPIPDPKKVAKSLFERGQYPSALRILDKAESKDAEWYYLRGRLQMETRNPGAAHESFRAAVRMDPDNTIYRQCALDAALALRRQETFTGRVRAWARRIGLSMMTGRVRL